MRVALLFLAAWLGGGCRAYQDREAIRSLVASLGPRLSGERSVLGAVETHGDEIELLDGGLTLVARVVHDHDQRGSSFHVHAMATPRGQTTGGFDICLVGRDLAEVADELVKYALPPIVSAIRDEPVLGASHAWGDTTNAIAGHSSYIGPYGARGTAKLSSTSRLVDAGLFVDPPQLPGDERMHLLKVVAVADGGAWRRTIELDGENAIASDKRLDVPSEASNVLVVFAVLDGRADPAPDEHAREQALVRLAAHPAWLPDPTTCPTKLLPLTLERRWWDPVAARGGRLLHAIRGCERGAVELCYAAAQEFVQEVPPSAAAQSLFLRACGLGHPSACTNAAAGRMPPDDCAFETFEASCERGKDPWGCTMLGVALGKGDVKHRDVARARKVLPRGCALGEDDPACQAAKRILESLDAAPSTDPANRP